MVVAAPDTEPSFRRAAAYLQDLRGHEGDPTFVRSAQNAVRGAMLAVEKELHAIGAAGGLRPRIVFDQPRLIPQLEQLERDLSQALVSLWEIRSDGSSTASLESLGRRLPRLADQLFSLVHDSLIEVGGAD